MNTAVNLNIKGKLTEHFLPKDILVLYTFLSLFGKSLLFIGFMINRIHVWPKVFSAFRMIFTLYPYRPFYYFGFILIMMAPTLLLRRRVRIVILIVLNFLFSLLLLTDLWYLRAFDTLPTLHLLQASSNLTETVSSFTAMIYPIDILFLIDIPFAVFYGFYKRTNYKAVPRNVVFAFLLMAFSIMLMVLGAPMANKITRNIPSNWIFYKFDATNTTYNISPLGYGFYSSYLFFTESNSITLDHKELKKIKLWYERKKENLPDNKYRSILKGKNLIVIQVESLEKFVINQKINGQEITPNLNKLLRNSLFFTNYYEQVGGGNSSDADLMTNTSVYPVQMGTTFFRFPYNYYNSLPKLFKKMGYYTSAIHPDDGAFWNWMPALKSMGFNKCYDSSCYQTSEVINMGISDGVYLPQAEAIIAKQRQPFYTFLVTLSSHTPFGLPQKYRELNLGDKLDKSKLGGYLQCVHYTDKQLGIFFNTLRNKHILDNTVIAIYGDHEGVHKYFPKDVADFKPAENWWLNNGKKIPLIIYQKDLKGAKINTIGGQIDIMPTLSYLLGIDEKAYSDTVMGRNLLNTKKNFAVLRNRQVIGSDNKKEKEYALQGLEIGDTIIRSNYFKHINSTHN